MTPPPRATDGATVAESTDEDAARHRETAVQSMAHMTIAGTHLRELIKARVHQRAASRAFKHLDRAMEILTEAIRADALKEL